MATQDELLVEIRKVTTKVYRYSQEAADSIENTMRLIEAYKDNACRELLEEMLDHYTPYRPITDSDEAKFIARDKEPNREFVGPDDYGRLTFNYPKTWSVYVSQDVTQGGGTYQAYLNPVSVPVVSASQQFALRVTIEQKDYDTVISSYASLVKKGDLHSSVVSVNGSNGTRLDGNFSKDIRGSAVIYKIRDKTLTIRTDADTFKPDFEALIATIKFNQ